MKHGSQTLVKLDVAVNGGEVLRPQRCPEVTVVWKNIGYCVQDGKGKKKVLSRLYGEAAPGTLTAVMGPSGAGKTTLLNIVSGHIDKGYEGEVQVNGYVRDSKLFNMHSCYVMQDDCLLQHLTVREALTMSAELRLPTLEHQELLKLEKNEVKRLYAVKFSPHQQMKVLLKRCFLCLTRNKVCVPTIMMSIVYWTTSQPMELYRIATVLLFSILVSSVGQSLAYVCSTAFRLQLAVFVALPAVAPWILFSGSFVQQRYVSAAVWWFTYTSHVYYGHRAMMFAVFGGGRGQLECDERDAGIACHPVDGEDVLDMLQARDVNLSEYFSILLAIDLSLKLIAFSLLKWRLWRKY
ncbi:hypothetical protein HPB48_001705 [Haemaphysalis longicornis]|uniref:ABC transporter domain-containing protein n=1 Tax=Haemaphysalis longicornis TaxID=44386 RepID=A0A9J6FZN4_HAELO|nr:hypothetical protein HPB48_001705 [Haemaphysalis longicornis]